MGTEINVASLLPGVLPVTYEEDGALVGEVLWVDRYGNAQLNIDPDEIESFGDRLRVRFGDEIRTARRVAAFGEVGPNEIGLVVDSYGLLAIVVDRHSAATELGLHPSTEVRIEAFDDDDDDAARGVTSPVQLRTNQIGCTVMRPGTAIALGVLLVAHSRCRVPAVGRVRALTPANRLTRPRRADRG